MAFDALKERFRETRIGKQIDKIRTVMSEIKDSQVSLDREYEYKEGDVEKDILFKSETIANDYKKSEQTAKSKKEEAEKKKEEIRKKDYLLTSAKEKLAALEKEKEELTNQIATTEEGEEKEKLRKKLADEYSDEKINGGAIEKILEHADKKAEQLRSDDPEEKREGFDYKMQALDDAIKEAEGDEKALTLLQSARGQYETEQNQRLGIFEGITQSFKEFGEKKSEEEKRIGALAEGSEEQKLLQSQMEADYGNEAKKNAAVQEALKRVQARAAYLSANDPDYKEDTDYVEKAFKEAQGKVDQMEDGDEKTKIQEAIDEAKKQYNEQKGKAREEAEPKEDPRIAELKAREQHIITTMAAEQNADMKPHYEKMLAEVREQIAQLTVEQTAASKAEAKRKEEERKIETEQKTAAARKKADEILAKKQKPPAQEAPQPESKKQATKEPTDKDYFNDFLGSIKLEETGKKPVDDDDDEDYDFGPSLFDEPSETFSAQDNLEKAKKAFKYVRTVGDMRKILTSWFFALMGSIQDLDKKAQKKLLPIMQKVKSNIDIAFNTLGPLIKELEGGDKINAMGVINMSSLVNQVNDALHLAKQHLYGFDEPYEIITGMIRGLHATEFTQLARTFLLEHSEDVLDENGEETGETRKAFKKMNRYGSWWDNGSTKNGSASDASNCFRAIIRAIINVINAQTYLDPNASRILKDFTTQCYGILQNNPQRFDIDKVKRTIRSILDARGTYDEQIRKLEGNSAGRDPSKNAHKLSELLDLLNRLLKNPSDTAIINEIKTKLKKIMDFSGLSSIIRDQSTESKDNFWSHIFEDDYEQLEEKK